MTTNASQSETRTTLRKAAREIRIVGFVDYRRYLHNLYLWVKKTLDSYSYIQFSIDTGLGKSNASRLIITGARNLSNQHAADIAANLGIRGHQALYFEGMVRYSNARSLPEREEVFADLMHSKSRIEPESLTEEQIAYFSSWMNPVIKELASSDAFTGDIDWIQEVINFPTRRDEVKRALNLLSQIGVLSLNDKTEKYAFTGTGSELGKIDDLAAIRYHQAMIDAGKESLTRLTGKERDISGITALISKETFNKLREQIKLLIEDIEKLETEDQNKPDRDVYQVNVQLFPFTNVSKK